MNRDVEFLLQGRSAAEQQAAVIKSFPRVPAWFRRLFPYSKWGAELNARITPAFFTWLVGPMQTQEAVVDAGVVQQSAVHIERCRWPLVLLLLTFNQHFCGMPRKVGTLD